MKKSQSRLLISQTGSTCKESIFGKWKFYRKYFRSFREEQNTHTQTIRKCLILRVKQSGCPFANLCFFAASVDDRESAVSLFSFFLSTSSYFA